MACRVDSLIYQADILNSQNYQELVFCSEVSKPSALSGNALGQVVHAHVPLSPRGIIWAYWPNRREGYGWLYAKLWLSYHISELRLHLRLARGDGNRDEHRLHQSQNCESAIDYRLISLDFLFVTIWNSLLSSFLLSLLSSVFKKHLKTLFWTACLTVI